jgi:hypothetical protein
MSSTTLMDTKVPTGGSIVVGLTEAKQLITCLEAQAPLYEASLQQLLSKKVALLSNNLTQLTQADATLKELRKKLMPLEKERVAWLQQHWAALHLPAEVMPHTEALMAVFPQPLRTDLKNVQLRLRRSLQQIEPLQQELTQLLTLSLRWVEQNLDWVRQHMATPTGGAYEVKGFTSKPTRPKSSKPTVEKTI